MLLQIKIIIQRFFAITIGKTEILGIFLHFYAEIILKLKGLYKNEAALFD